MSGAYHLSDLDADKVEIACECGLRRRYDRQRLMERIGDYDLPSLPHKLAGAEGCRRVGSVDLHATCRMEFATGLKVRARER